MEKESKQHRIYDKGTRTWFEIPEEEYREFDRKRTALRRRMQYQHHCTCPRDKFWLCDCMCEDCEFQTTPMVSLDDPLPDAEGTLGDYVPDDKPTVDEVLADRDLLERLIKRLHEIDPEADRIIRIWQDNPEGISDRKVAEILGRKQRTFADEMKKFRDEFRAERNS